MKCYVINSKEHGVYLGNYVGEDFWSESNRIRVHYVPSFQDEFEVKQMLDNRTSDAPFPEYTLVEIEESPFNLISNYVPWGSCQRAGLIK